MSLQPALVVHGIANHDARAFSQVVARLQTQLAATHRLIEVFWGDLGGVGQGLADSLPAIFPQADGTRAGPGPGSDSELAQLLLQQRALLNGADAPQALTRSDGQADDPAEALYRATVERLTQAAVVQPATFATRAGEDELQATLRQALQGTTHLRRLEDPALQAAAADLLADYLRSAARADPGITEPGEIVTRGVFDDARSAIAGFVRKIDELIGAASSNVAGSAQQWMRGRLAEPIALTLGDIVAYHQRRDEIQGRLFAALDQQAPGWGSAEQPIPVLAHSLGGLVVFDAAVQASGRRLHLSRFTSFGSQAAFFHVLAPRQGIGAYAPGQPVALPPSIQAWTNLWHPLDMLAFAAGTVFRLHDGRPPVDVRVDTPASEIVDRVGWLHSCYWESAALLAAVRAA